MKGKSFTIFADKCIKELENEGHYSTAHLYKNALRSFTEFCRTPMIWFSQINRNNLKSYYQYLMDYHKKLNTISTYMRMLRSIYNKGVDRHLAPYVHRLFHDVYTGIDSAHKKSIPANELHKLLYAKPHTEKLQRTQKIANLLFQFCGMSFVDFAYMEKVNISDGILEYQRRKTGTKVSIEVMPSSGTLISQLENPQKYPDNNVNYMFDILSGSNGKRDYAGHVEYQSALRHFNANLKLLAQSLNVHSSVSSYTFRHSWATTAKYLGVPIEMISESLGHRSIKTTQIYLKGFNVTQLAKVNTLNYQYISNEDMISGRAITRYFTSNGLLIQR